MRALFKALAATAILFLAPSAQAIGVPTDVKCTQGIRVAPLHPEITLGTRTPIERPRSEAIGGGASAVTAGGSNLLIAEKTQPTAFTTWVSGGATHTVVTVKWKDENSEAWAQRHKQAVGPMKAAFPPDAPPPPATGGLVSNVYYSTWQSQDAGDLFALRQDVRTAIDPGMQVVGAPPGQGQTNQAALHAEAVHALLAEYPSIGP